MVLVLRGGGNGRFKGVLAAMHRDRKRVFVDRLRWRVPVVADEFEVDGFDTDAAVYLLNLDAERRHLGSLRLLPSTGPHLLADVFPHLCQRGVPRGDDVWEITRLCTSPEASAAKTVRQELAVAVIEYALLSGIRQLTSVTHLAYLSQLLSVGWDCEPLGLPQELDGVAVGAVVINVTSETLALMRRRTGLSGSLLCWDLRDAA